MWTLWKKNTQCITFVIKIKKSFYYILHIGIKQDAIILINVYLLCRIKESSASSIFLFLEGEGFGSFTSLGEFLVKRKIYKNFKNSINLFLKFLYIWHLKTFKHLFLMIKNQNLPWIEDHRKAVTQLHPFLFEVPKISSRWRCHCVFTLVIPEKTVIQER